MKAEMEWKHHSDAIKESASSSNERKTGPLAINTNSETATRLYEILWILFLTKLILLKVAQLDLCSAELR